MPQVLWEIELADGTHAVKLSEWEFISTRRSLRIDGKPIAFETQKVDHVHQTLRANWREHSLNIDINVVKNLIAYSYDLAVDGGPVMRGITVTRSIRTSVVRGVIIGALLFVVMATLIGNIASHPLWEHLVLGSVFVAIVAFAEFYLARSVANRYHLARLQDTNADKGLNPVCPQCRTIYNRSEVIRQLKQQSPEMFDFAGWTTKFRCKECGAEIAISS